MEGNICELEVGKNSITEYDILDSLDDLGYSFNDDSKIKEAVEIGSKSIEFTQLIEWFSKELQTLCKMDSCVNAITDSADSSSFLLEVSSFLKELQCPYKSLISGPISQRLQDVKSRYVLLDFLCTELQAARISYKRNKKMKAFEIEIDDSSTAACLTNAQNILDIKLGENEDPMSLFAEIERKINEHISSSPGLILKPALEESLSEQQWLYLNSLHKEFLYEYQVRRELLLTRIDVTIKSFQWGEGRKRKEILKAYVYKRADLKKIPSVKLSDIIAARSYIWIIEKTSSDELVKNTKSSLNRHIISAVPDRGGRPKEQMPPVEMPGWSKRSSGGGGRVGDFWLSARGGCVVLRTEEGDYRGGGGRHGGRNRGHRGGDHRRRGSGGGGGNFVSSSAY
ncbi:protein FAM98A [Caerostris extrusa]|uniref:Protein FAM98A n=1 Tax=Caerostris extrusa TaxID=172846 RepID=A0AAV4NWW9_CAEEX|nr:protein FAM98A [Caerostris extrusa]